MKMGRLLLIQLVGVLLLGATLFSQNDRGERPKNIILMIGDGMGVAQITAGRTFKGTLELERFKQMGLLITHVDDKHYVGESAGGATAMATGVKSYQGIAVHPDSTPAITALEKAKLLGKKTGIVTVCSITHATPAAFVAHVPHRSMELEIASQISDAQTDIYLGSGWGWFLPLEKGGRRKDGRDLIEKMVSKGYSYFSTPEEFYSFDFRSSKRVLGLFAENHVGYAQIRKPSLKEMTSRAIQYLSSGAEGFFLMIEGSQIDWAGHANLSDQIMIEMADFDDAIGVALDFSEKNKETLLIITADHETGGYSLVGGSISKRTVKGHFATDKHSAAMVPIFSYGPNSGRFTGIIDNTVVGKQLLEILDRTSRK